MIICDKCGASNGDERFICCDCGRELVKPKNENSEQGKDENLNKDSFNKQEHKENFYNGNDTRKKVCKNCGTYSSFDSFFCRRCGKPLEEDRYYNEGNVLYCCHCGEKNNVGSKFCNKCGRSIAKPESNIQHAKKDRFKTAMIFVVVAIIILFLINVFAIFYQIGNIIDKTDKDIYRNMPRHRMEHCINNNHLQRKNVPF